MVRQKDGKKKRWKYAKTKRELNIAMSGQFLTLAMFQRLQGVEMSLQDTPALQHWRKTATLQQLRKLTTLQHWRKVATAALRRPWPTFNNNDVFRSAPSFLSSYYWLLFRCVSVSRTYPVAKCFGVAKLPIRPWEVICFPKGVTKTFPPYEFMGPKLFDPKLTRLSHCKFFFKFCEILFRQNLLEKVPLLSLSLENV